MKVQHEIRGDILILKPVGRLDSTSSPDLERALIEQLDTGHKRLVFDFSELDYLSSAGLRVILIAGKRLRPVQGKLVLSGMQAAVQEIFEMSGFLTLFAVAPDVNAALALV